MIGPDLHTVWEIVRFDGDRVKMTLVVDTTAPIVVRRIEDAAAANGVTLRRVEEEEA